MPKGLRAAGADSWNETFGESRAVNMGYGWDRIENVLWRVYHEELDGFNADLILINIGTNNLQYNTDEEILEGWQLLVDAIKYRQPKAARNIFLTACIRMQKVIRYWEKRSGHL